MVEVNIKEIEAAKCISGPHEMFSGSFILEWLEVPPSLNASTLFRATYIASHHLTSLGKSHPQSPPLHLHFSQCETFVVASGALGTTSTWATKDDIWTKHNTTTPHTISPWVPHRFWPVDGEGKGEDTVAYFWVHPDKVEGGEEMDWLFFRNVLGLVSESTEGKSGLGGFQMMLQIMVSQHASATALIMFPHAWWLGPLRWWIPWKFQAGFAAIGRALGYRALMERYTPKEEWEAYLHAKRA